MKRLRIFLASLAACAILATPAHAANGNGLYEPFPSPTSESLAQAFVDGLPGGLSYTAPDGLDLGRGVFVGNGAKAAYATSTATPSRSVSGAGFAPSLGWPLALVLLAAVLGGAGVLAARRRA